MSAPPSDVSEPRLTGYCTTKVADMQFICKPALHARARGDIAGFSFRLGEKSCTMDSSNSQDSSYFNITERIHH